jgi:hypothetical protein
MNSGLPLAGSQNRHLTSSTTLQVTEQARISQWTLAS